MTYTGVVRGVCPDGSPPSTDTPPPACYPSDCVSYQTLDWGLGGTPPADLYLPKFDADDGLLLSAEVQFKLWFKGEVCADNQELSCCLFEADARFLGLASPDPGNNPPVTGVGTVPYDYSLTLTPTGFYLGSADGVDECNPPSSLNMSNGSCPGEDHVYIQWDEFDDTFQPILITNPTDLVPWIDYSAASNETVRFNVIAQGLLDSTTCLTLDPILDASARVQYEVTYTYCPNACPTCATGAPSYQVCQNGDGITIDLLQHVTDIDGCIDCSTFQITDQPDHAAADLVPSCTGMGNKDDPVACSDCLTCEVTYLPDPDADFCQRDQFTFKVADDKGCEVTCTILITVNEANEAPVAHDDLGHTTCEGQPIDITVCANDVDPDNNQSCGCDLQCGALLPNDVVITVPPSCGTAQSIGEGKIRFTPAAGYCGPGACTFKYKLRDQCLQTGPCKEALWSNEATVSVTVYAVNQAPVAVDDPNATTCEGQPVDIPVCLNDGDPDNGNCGCPLDCLGLPPGHVQITVPPSCGTASSIGNGYVRFTPNAGFCGSCTFKYKIKDDCDGVGDWNGTTGSCTVEQWSNEATVTVTVFAVNQPPVAVDDPNATTCEGQSVDIPVCANDSDPDNGNCGCPLTCGGMVAADLQVTVPPSCGTATPITGGRIRFTPADEFCGSCTFKYKIRDDCTGVGDWTGARANCTVEQWSNEATVTVNVYAVNDPPVAVPDNPDPVLPGSTTLFDVCSNDSDPDPAGTCGCPLDCATLLAIDLQVTQPDCSGGSAVVLPGGKVRFTAPGNCTVCEFTYRIRDNCNGVGDWNGSSGNCTMEQWSNWATVTVIVTGDNEAPTAVDDFANTDEDTPVSVFVCGNDTDPNNTNGCGCPLVCSPKPADDIVITRPPDCGGTAVPLTNGRVLFTPPPDWCGDCSFDYIIRDDCVDSAEDLWSNEATVYVHVEGVNDPPVAVDDEAWTKMDIPVDIIVCDNDYDIDNGVPPPGCGCILLCPNSHVEITWWDSNCAAQQPTVDALGTVTFVPAPGYIGDCQFGYKIWDTDPTTGTPCDFAEATVTVHINDICEPIITRQPGSLLLYPEFDNRAGIVTVLTVGNEGFEEIDVHFVYRDEQTCSEYDRTVLLTGRDTLTLITNFHNPEQDRGYVYVYARCPGTHDEVVYNHLIGNLMVVDGLEAFSYSINPFDFRGIGHLPNETGTYSSKCGTMLLTDLDGDGLLDLDGMEYEYAQDQLLIPRFLGQTADIKSDLILIDITGGGDFDTIVDFQIYNDNEEEFSAEYQFTCWTRVPLLGISAIFSQNFLVAGTNQNPLEILGQEDHESGWMRIDGAMANSAWRSIENPAILAVLVESVIDERWVADLPFFYCSQDNGALLPSTPAGDQD